MADDYEEKYTKPSMNKAALKKAIIAAYDEKGGGLHAKTKAELYEMAKERDVEGRSGMTKSELAEALRETD